MAGHDTDTDDRELERLFSALDDVVASEELKQRTLSAIFDQVEADQAEDKGFEVVAPALTVIEGGDAGHAKKSGRAKARRAGLLPRVAAILLVCVLAGGGVAYAMPTSHMAITSGDTTVDLGVNIFGVTIEVSADGEGAEEVLEGLDVRGKGYEEAMELVTSTFDKRAPSDEGLEIQVRGGIGRQHEEMDEAADRMMERRVPEDALPSGQTDGVFGLPEAPADNGAYDLQADAMGQGTQQPEQTMDHGGQPDNAGGMPQPDGVQAPDGYGPAVDDAV